MSHKTRKRNKTGILIGSIYCIGLFIFLIQAPPGEAPNNPYWYYAMIPLGALTITFLFDHVIKFDVFDISKKKIS